MAKKMSKSDASDYSRIDLADTEDEIIKKSKKLKQTLYQYLHKCQI